MKSLKIINISSNGSLSFKYFSKNFVKQNNRNILTKNDDKNFILNQKTVKNTHIFGSQINYKKKYI